MTTDRELMQQALSALTQASPSGWSMDSTKRHYGTIEALRARLAQPEQEPIKYEEWNYDPMTGKPLWGEQPEQEPVAWLYMVGEFKHVHGKQIDHYYSLDNGETRIKGIPLYTAPPQREWQTLTENEIKHLWYEACQTNLELTSQLIVHLARNIEAKLREKNT